MYLSTATTLVAAAATLFSSASAVKVLSPDQNTVWASGTSSQTIVWEAVSTDPDSFTVQLVNQAGFLTNSPVTLISSQARGSANVQNTASVTYPSGSWPVGQAFQINLVTNASSNQAILAQSSQFNISSSGSGSGSSASATTGTSSTSTGTPPQTLAGLQTSSTTAVTSSTTGSGSSSSSGAANALPNVAASSKAAGELTAAPSVILSAAMGIAAYFGVFA